MDFNFNINNLLANVITKLDCEIKPDRRNADGYDAVGLQNLLVSVIDKMGQASAKAQGIPNVITTGRKLQYSDHKLYIMKDPNGNNGRGTVLGILKIGHKKLFVYNHHGNVHEMEPLCVLDFYVHESRQRMGCGRKLFDFMLEDQGCSPQHLAIDKPSFKFSQFLSKHYKLRAVVPQVNNFVIFEGFFTNRPDVGVKRRTPGLGRPPSHPNKRREYNLDEGLHRQNTYNGYGLPPLAPRASPSSGHRIRSRPGSGDSVVNAVSNHTTPRKDLGDYQRNGQLRPISASGDDDRQPGAINSIQDQSRPMYSRLGNHGNTESSQLIRQSPTLQRPSSNTIGNINRGNINHNALPRDQTVIPRNNSDSQLAQRNEPRLESRLLQRNDSADSLRRRTPVLDRHVTADNYLQNLNLHQEYQGRRGHMKINTFIDDKPARNPFMTKEEDRAHSGWRPTPEQSNWTVFNREPGYLSIASRNYTHTRLW